MVLSEAQAEAQLARLRRQRETLDRAIADLSLYLELGRRLTAGPIPPFETAPGAMPASAAWPGPRPDLAERGDAEEDGLRRAPRPDRAPPPAASPSDPGRRGFEAARSVDEIPRAAAAPPPPEADRDGDDAGSRDGVLSEGVLARRHGRALIEAALAALEEAGRPLHAGEIFAVLAARGFSLPGHDPVAALNTRLWKRSGPGGPLRRMGDAVYALAEPEDEIRPDPASR